MSSVNASSPIDLPDPPIQPVVFGEGIHRVVDVLPGLAKREAFAEICGDVDPDKLMEAAHLLCFRGDGYPRVDDHTGHILCPDGYISEHEPLIVYLDILHELVHVRQVLEGRQVYHFPEPYVEWPTEIEAYRITYDEAKRLGVPDDWFWRYLAVPWIEEAEIVRLGRAIGMPAPGGPGEATDDQAPDEEGARH